MGKQNWGKGEWGKVKGARLLQTLALLVGISVFPLPLTLSSAAARAALNDAARVSTATREGRLAVFDDAWSRINDRYYDQTFHGVDWDSQRINFRTQAANSVTSQELYAVLRRMIAPLNDPHTRVFAPEEKFDWWRPRFVTVGLSIAEVAGQPTVISVEPNSAPARAGIRPGDVIEEVDGEAALKTVGNRLAALPDAVTPSVRFRVFAKLLDGPTDTQVEVSWKTRNGKKKSARFLRYWQQRELGLQYRREGSVAVIEINAFTKPIATAFAQVLSERLSGARGVVLDLRSNGGGDAEAMSDIASGFLGVGTNLGLFTDRTGSSFGISTHSKSLLIPNLIPHTELPLIVLTSERTASAAEILVEALRVSGRARVVGAETCGCVLAVRTRHILPDGGLLDVSELNYETAAGQRLEKHGIKPDEKVSIERGDLYSKRDRVFELAMTKLSTR